MKWMYRCTTPNALRFLLGRLPVEGSCGWQRFELRYRLKDVLFYFSLKIRYYTVLKPGGGKKGESQRPGPFPGFQNHVEMVL